MILNALRALTGKPESAKATSHQAAEDAEAPAHPNGLCEPGETTTT